MILRKSLVAALTSTVLCVPAAAQNDNFSKRFYIGAAGGVSDLSPESRVDTLTIDDESDTGGKFLIGYDVSRRIGLELAAADLGAAEIGPNNVGEIDYSVLEFSGLFHFFNLSGWDALVERRGLGAFVKLGVGVLDNDSELEFERVNDVHVSGGVGLEYGLPIGLALRGEYEAFDEDARLASLGLLWRFGGNGGFIPSVPDGGLFTPGDEVTTTAATIVDDSDGDGVPNSIDDCPDTAPEAAVTATGCAIFGGALEGVNFESDSDLLLDDALIALNVAADVMLRDPTLKVEVQSHTDSQASEGYNLQLSKNRALSTVRYLILRGVPQQQLTARAFGETKPIADNATEEGRRENRRVEFHVIE